MNSIQQPYTLGVWTVKSGHQEAFIAEWTVFARWTSKTHSHAGQAYLLQDREHPQQFISFGPWDDELSIAEWRPQSEFKDFVARVRELCDDFQPRSLRVVATSAE